MFRFPRLNLLPLVLALLGAPLACLDTIEPGEGIEPLPENDSGRRDLTFTFDSGESTWTGGISDFPTNKDPQDIHFTLRRDTTPVGTDRQANALFVSSTNVSDDLFTFITLMVGRLKPNTPYALTFEVELASNAPRRCPSVNGSPGEDVFLKVGASLVQPAAVTNTETQQVRLNVDKGNQSVGSENAQTLGDIANDSEQCFNTPYRIITRDNVGNPLRITTDANGRLWLFVGTDSDYSGTTELYYDVIHVVLQPS